jgi:putative addiction module component (TIGR02574 family)
LLIKGLRNNFFATILHLLKKDEKEKSLLLLKVNFMASVNIDKLLSLPQKERKKIAEKLWDSLAPTSPSENDITKILEKRWNNLKNGKNKPVSSSQFWKKVETYLATKTK